MKKKFLIINLVVILFTFSWTDTLACTNFVVTKGASQDGSTMVTYAADSHTLYGELYYRPAASYPAGTMMTVIEWDSGTLMGEIPQVSHTYSVVGNINEHQLIIAETTYGGLNELSKPNGIMDYGSLIYITLQRAKNAREAIKTIAFLLDSYGYCSSGESFSIIDPNEAWIMELIGKGEEMKDKKGKTLKGWTKGAVWVARRIPDGYISGHANQARITTFPLADGKTSITSKEMNKIFDPAIETIYSQDVISFAKLKGLYPVNAPDAEFSFSHTYAPLDFSAARFCESRVWMGFYRCNPALMAPYEKYARGEDLNSKEKMPLWIKPTKKLSVLDVMELMRDHFEGSTMDMTKDIGAGPFECPYRWRPMTWEHRGKNYIHERATATQQTGFSFVGQAKNWLPDKFGGILWFGVDDAASSCYVPMFCGITEIPEPFKEGNGSMIEYSSTAAYWIFNKVSNFAYSRYKDMIVPIKAKQHEFESKWVKEIKDMEKEMIALFKSNEKEAIAKLNKYANEQTKEMCYAWDRLFEYLLVKFHDGNIKIEENGKFKVTDVAIPQCVFPEQPKYSDKWYDAIIEDCGSNIIEPGQE